MTHVYFDHNATTPLDERVLEAMLPYLREQYGNASSRHEFGTQARKAVNQAREQVAALVGVQPVQVVFTSGGTEANNAFIKGAAGMWKPSQLAVSAIEHPCVAKPAQELTRAGWKLRKLAVNSDGRVDLGDVAQALKEPAGIVSVMLANNETGVLQPVAEAVALARRYGALIHCDAVQAPGKIATDMHDLGVDSVSLSAHKFGGIKGAGVLALRGGVEIAADMLGGGQERRRRAGTENVPGIVGMGAAARYAGRLLDGGSRVTELRDELEAAVKSAAPQARIFGKDRPRLGNTSCISLPGISSETQVMRLDLAGVAVSAGSACSSGKIAPSHVLLAMGVDPHEAKSAIRVSLGWETTRADTSRFLEVWLALAAQFQDS